VGGVAVDPVGGGAVTTGILGDGSIEEGIGADSWGEFNIYATKCHLVKLLLYHAKLHFYDPLRHFQFGQHWGNYSGRGRKMRERGVN
jgi:hypothetical protein